jgi:hypothetical protein
LNMTFLSTLRTTASFTTGLRIAHYFLNVSRETFSPNSMFLTPPRAFAKTRL